MSSDSDFEKFAESVKAVAAEVGALVVTAYLEIADKSGVPQAVLDLNELIAVARHIEPKVLYFIERDFEFESEIGDLKDSLGIDDELSDRHGDMEALEKLRKKWRKHDGKRCLAYAAFMADGAVVTSMSRPTWRDEFWAEVESLEEGARNALDEERSEFRRRDSADVREKVAILVNHASFNAGRTSFDKRVFLAEQLFPDLDPDQLQAITRRAENLDWLNKSGFKP